MGRHLVAHQRHAGEIGHLLGLGQAQRFARIPFLHQHQLATQREALQEDGHFAGHVEQRNGDQRAGLQGRRLTLAGKVGQRHQALHDIAHRAVDHRAMIAIGAFRAAGGARSVEQGGVIVRAELGQGRLCGIAPDRCQPFSRIAVMLERNDLRAVIGAFEPFGPLAIGQNHPAADHLERVGHFLAAGETVDQRGAAAGHGDPHIGDDPVGGIARGDADSVALDQLVLRQQPRRHVQGGIVGFAEGQPAAIIDKEFGVLMRSAIIREIVRQAGRGVLEGGHRHAVAGERHGLRRAAGRNQPVHDRIQRIVELGRH